MSSTWPPARTCCRSHPRSWWPAPSDLPPCRPSPHSGAAMMIGGAAHALRSNWVEWVSVAAAALTSGAVLRFIAHGLFRLGPTARDASRRRLTEHPDTPAAMWVPAAGLIAIGLLAGLAPRLTGAAEPPPSTFRTATRMPQRVLDNHEPLSADALATSRDRRAISRAARPPSASPSCSPLSLCAPPRPGASAAALGRVRQLHRRLVPDYVTWIMVGLGVFGAVAVVWLRSY